MAGAIHLGDVGNVEWSDDEDLRSGSEDRSDDELSSASNDEDGAEEIRALDYTPVELLRSHQQRTSTARLESGTSTACRQSGSRSLRGAPAVASEFGRHNSGSQSRPFRRVAGRSGVEVRTCTNPMRQNAAPLRQPRETRSGDCQQRVGGRRPAAQRKRIRKNGNWTDEQMRCAIAAVDDGVSFRKAAEDNHIPLTTLRDWYQGRTRSRMRGRKGVLTADEESQLVQYLIKMCDAGYGLSPNALKMKVYEITKSRSTPFWDGIPGSGWMRWFRIRHPELTIRAAQTLETARAKSLCPENVATLYNNLEELCRLHHYPPHRIWNCDESGAQAGDVSSFNFAISILMLNELKPRTQQLVIKRLTFFFFPQGGVEAAWSLLRLVSGVCTQSYLQTGNGYQFLSA